MNSRGELLKLQSFRMHSYTMITNFPKRPPEHQLEDVSLNYFRGCLPKAWTCERSSQDYGIDVRVGLAQEGQLNGQFFVAQLKATASAPLGNYVSMRLSVPTLNYLRNMLDVVLLVIYVAEVQEAYWIFLKDFTSVPRKGQKTVSIAIPKENTLSQNSWEKISAHVSAVHYRKLQANVQTQ